MPHKYFDHAGNAEVLQVSSETVLRDWRMAKTWLYRELSRNSVKS